MDYQIKYSPDTICEGCLSVDRKLTSLNDEECRKYFRSLLDSFLLDQKASVPLLCWECASLVRRAVQFRGQVKHVQESLVKYRLDQSQNITPQTKLSCSSPNQLIIVCHADSPVTQANLLESIANTQANSKVTSNAWVDSVGNAKTEPLAFIKMEGMMDDDEFYVDDEGVNKNRDFEGEESKKKTPLKSDPFQYEVAVDKVVINTKISKKKTKEIEFDESDDEPLNVKKMREIKESKERKPRGRRKKKEDNATPKTDRRKQPGKRREKPPGVIDNARVRRKLEQLNIDASQLEMVVLSWEEVEAERQLALSSEAFTRHEYRCHSCVLGFNHRTKLETHMKKHDPAAGTARCAVCGVVCRDQRALCAHTRRHRLRWRCVRCGATWSRAGVAADHLARQHRAPAPTHTCRLCGHTEPSLGKLRNHIKNHAERQKCELCDKTFRDRTSLRTHLFIHRGEKEYSCPRCGKQFLFKKAMEVHLVTHDASQHLYCHQCDMNFKNRMSYYQHIKYNLKHIDPAKLKFACQLCDKRFVKARRLEEHHVAVHLKATPVKCTHDGCNFACSSRPVLRTHVRMVHRNARAARNHVCHACGKAYTTKKTLEGHMRSHTGERPFRCQLCPSRFGYEAALYNHNKLVHLKPKTGRGRAAPPVLPPVLPPAWPAPPAPPEPPAPLQSTQEDNIS